MAFTGLRRRAQPHPAPQHPAARPNVGVESNARLTASTGAVIFVLLAAEGVTLLRIRGLLSPHVFLGMLVIPPVVVKTVSTSYRFVRYYTGAPAYRKKGPPPAILRLIGPVVVILTAVVLVTGVALLFVGPGSRSTMLFLHKASFVLWFGAMTIHVLGHLLDTVRVAPRDWMRRSRRAVAGAGARQWVVAGSLVAGALLGVLLLGRVGPWLASTPHVGH